MAIFSYRPVVTDIGLQKINEAIANGTDIILDTIALGDAGSDLDYDPIPSMTELKNEVTRIRARTVTMDTHMFYGEAVMRVMGMLTPNNAIEMTVRECGVYDAEGDLILIARTSEISTKEPEALRTGLKIKISKKVPEAVKLLIRVNGIGNTEVLTTEELGEHISQSLNVHRTNKEHLGLSNIDNTPDDEKPISLLTLDVIHNTKMATGFIDRISNRLFNANNTLTLIINYPTGVYKRGVYYPLINNISINLGYQAEWEEMDGEGNPTGVIHPEVPAASGEFFICLDIVDNTLYIEENPDIENDIMVAYVICNVSQGIISVNDERHLASKNLHWYNTQELRNKISWLNGGEIDLEEDNDTSMNFNVSSPVMMANKDLVYSIVHDDIHDGDYEQDMLNIFPPVLYINASTEIVSAIGDTIPFLNSNNSLLYNHRATGQLLGVDNNKYINYLILYTADIVSPIKMVVGSVIYNTELDADLADISEFDYILERIKAKVAYKVVMHKDISYVSNPARARAAKIINMANNTSLRNAMVPKNHNDLGASRFEDDQHDIDNIEGLRKAIESAGQIQSVSTTGNLGSEDETVGDTIKLTTWQADTRGMPESDKSIVFTDLIGSVYSGGYKGAVLAPNGKIYCVPYGATQVLEIDPVTKTTTSIGSEYGSVQKWDGAALAPNGKIYCAPYYGAKQVLEIDPTTKTTTLIGSDYGSGYKWVGAVLAPNGKIYCLPYSTSQVLEIDPTTQTTTLIGSVYSGSNKWIGAVLAPNGKIYCLPDNISQVLEIDPITKTTTLVGSVYSGGGNKWKGAVLAPNGKIYCAPLHSAAQVLEIDPTTKTTTLIGSDYGSSNAKWIGAVLAPNGKIYCAPYGAKQVLEIDPITQTTTLIGSDYGISSAKWNDAVLAPNGKIYCVPHNAKQVLEIDPITKTTTLIGSDYGISSNKWLGTALAPNGKIYCIPNIGATQVLEIDPFPKSTDFGSYLMSGQFKI